jgi:DNA mismatch repair protein MutL
MSIRLLPNNLVNRISAGEVIDRPSGAIKELVENSIDSGATKIEVVVRDGGKNFICVSDNGCGMSKSDLELCVQRHATSKLPDDDLSFISTMGFRGEALPSIGSVARMTITSRSLNDENAWSISVDDGNVEAVKPSSGEVGTTVEIKDLFYATPARLKFLKSNRSESMAILDILQRICLAHYSIEFIFIDDGKKRLHLHKCEGENAQLKRISDVIGSNFVENSMYIENIKDDIKIYGYVSLPTLNYNNTTKQFMFVNGRAIRDKQILGAIRAGVMDVVPANRYPMVSIYIVTPPRFTDVNVHPNKAEVRFMDSGLIRAMIVSSIRKAIEKNGCKTSSSLSNKTIDILSNSLKTQSNFSNAKSANFNGELKDFYNNQKNISDYNELVKEQFAPMAKNENFEEIDENNFCDYLLGVAKTQIHKNYIISQTGDGLIITDAHAAHERIVYEKLKYYHKQDIATQILLLPEVIELSQLQTSAILEYSEKLRKLGLVIDSFGDDAVNVRETPALLGETNIKKLITDIADEIIELDDSVTLDKKIDCICATIACHSSVRTGRMLNQHEMNELLRQMEQTQSSGQCNHGRPTYIKLSLKDIDKLFER